MFFHENNRFEEKKACFGDFSIFRKIAVSGPYRRAIFWLILSIFWNIENTIPILRKHSKFCSFMKTIGLKKKSMFCGLFNFWQNRCIRTLPAWPFFGWFWVFFERLKIPFQFFWNIQNFVLSWKQSVWRKKRMFWGLLNFRQNRCIRTLPACHFLVDFEYFLKCWKYPSNSSETFKISFFHENNHFEEKKHFLGTSQFSAKSLYPDLTGVPFFGWFWVFFEILKIRFLFFENIQNFVLSWKQSVWRKKACFADFSIFGKIAVSGHYRHGHFLVDFEYFLKGWKYPSNSSETFKILFFHENNRFEEKKACFGDFSIFGKIAVSGPYRRAIFWLILNIFWNVENTLPILLKHSKFHSFMKIITLKKKSIFWGLLNFRQNRCIRTLPACHFLVDFEYFLKYWKYDSYSSKTFKILFFHENNQFEEKKHVLRTFQFLAKSLYPDITGMAIFWLILSIFWKVENTLPILLKHSKFCSFMKTIGLKKKKHVLGTSQFSAKSLYPDLTGVPFFGWFWIFFEMLKIPFQFFWNIQNFILSWK